MHRFLDDKGSVLFIQRPREVQDFVARQPRVLPLNPPPATHLSRQLLVSLARLLLIVLVVLVLALVFFLFGEERPERVRPVLTPAQRARAFRMP